MIKMNRILMFSVTFLLLGLLVAIPALAQEAKTAAEVLPLPESEVIRLDRILADIRNEKEDLKQLEKQLRSSDGVLEDVLSLRTDRLRMAIFVHTLDFAREISAQNSKNMDASAYLEEVRARLESLPDQARNTLDRLQTRIIYPSPDLPPEKFVLADQRLFAVIRETDEIFAALVAYIAIADDFGLDVTRERDYMVKQLTESAANRSVFMEKAMIDLDMLRSAVTTLPDNTDLVDWLHAVETRIKVTAHAMQKIVRLMNELELDSRQYRKQVLSATGEITADVLEISIVATLAAEWGRAIGKLIAIEGPKLLLQLLISTLIIFAALQIAKPIKKLVRKGLKSGRVSISHLLNEMIVSSVRNLVVMVGVLIALAQLGIELGPLLAGLGIAGFFIGFALQDSLSNFASGMLILFYRPFDVGDFVEAGGVRGKVKNMSLVNTTFLTIDNQRLIVPNNKIWSAVITNVTAQLTRRVDLVFGISYEDDLEKAGRILQEIVSQHDAVLKEPAPVVKVFELGESSVNFVVRPWVKTNDYYDVLWDLTKAVKLRFDEEGISIPYPQRDIHVKGTSAVLNAG
jgi:small conductance mechanosensitive channel